jgi:galactoside O-acetyltransferase
MANLIIRECKEYLEFFLRWIPGGTGNALRYIYYKPRCRYMGQNVSIFPGCTIRGEKNIIIGNNVGIGLYAQLYAGKKENSGFIEIGDMTTLNSHVMLNADINGEIWIGKNVLIGPNVVFRASNHSFERKDMIIRQQGHKPGRIIVGDDVWIGANAVILPNIDVGIGAVIGAGSVVNKNVSTYTIVGGVPAKPIGKRSFTEKTSPIDKDLELLNDE